MGDREWWRMDELTNWDRENDVSSHSPPLDATQDTDSRPFLEHTWLHPVSQTGSVFQILLSSQEVPNLDFRTPHATGQDDALLTSGGDWEQDSAFSAGSDWCQYWRLPHWFLQLHAIFNAWTSKMRETPLLLPMLTFPLCAYTVDSHLGTPCCDSLKSFLVWAGMFYPWLLMFLVILLRFFQIVLKLRVLLPQLSWLWRLQAWASFHTWLKILLFIMEYFATYLLCWGLNS